MQKFTPIGVTIAEISITGHRDMITANLISDKMHTSIVFVDNKNPMFSPTFNVSENPVKIKSLLLTQFYF